MHLLAVQSIPQTMLCLTLSTILLACWVVHAVYPRCEVVLSFNGNNNFDHNLAGYAIYILENSVFIFTGSSNFISNSAKSGTDSVTFSYAMTFMTKEPMVV